MENWDEIRFMTRYVWRTLLYLYDRLKVKDKIRLRNVDSYIELDPEAAEAFKTALYFSELVEAVREALRRLQFTMHEEVVPERYAAGQVETRLLARYLPSYIPVRRRRVEYATPANLLLATVLLETRAMASRTLQRLASKNGNPLYEAFRSYAVQRLQDIVHTCNMLLSDPIIRPLLREAVKRKARVEELEKVVELEYRRRPKLYRPYRKLIYYIRLLRVKMGVAAHSIEELAEKLLAIDITPAKIYELYGFTLILEALTEILDEKVGSLATANLDKQGRELVVSSGQLRLSIAYNAIPDSIKSKFENVRIYGLLNGKIEAPNLKGLPDTFIIVEGHGERRLLVIEYKYSRDLSYQVNSRFKVYAYLNEYNADIAVVVSPTPSPIDLSDEEVYGQAGFYTTIASRQGALLYIKGQGKILVILYLDPSEESLARAKEAFRRVLTIFLEPLLQV